MSNCECGGGDSYLSIAPRRSIIYGIAAAYLIYAGFRYLGTSENGAYTSLFWFIHAPVHEIGHLLPGLIGLPEMWVMLGGTVFQLLCPVVAAIVLMRRGEHAGWTVGLGWLGLATLDMAVYMEDARPLKLGLASPFAGGGPVEHDWNAIFDRWDVLMYAYTISDVCAIVGYVMVFGAAALMILMIVRGALPKRASSGVMETEDA